jgi:DNA-binding transcriptional regulator LsrR (DeoR family)
LSAWRTNRGTPQFHLADALGLTCVHVNRTLRKLREAGLVSVREGRVEIMDLDGLIKLAEFDPAYLDQTGPLLM